ncbi:YadA-like family protein [Acinetobacter piscicola]|uniref:YadA-like family protein n=1 Tax=Acinetobacter piscicola TaxID=2006115 RepID=UPI001D18E7D3|nr:YadA-like family protein [Acinetobacter piscicola]
MVIGLSASFAHAATVTSEADTYKYANAAGNEILKVEIRNGDKEIIQSGYYTVGANKELKVFTGDTSAYTKLISGGQVKAQYDADDVSDNKQINTQNDYWAHNSATTTGLEFKLDGQLVDSAGNVVDNIDYFNVDKTVALASKSVEVGNIGSLVQVQADRNYTLSKSSENAQGVIANDKSAVTALTGNGLALVNNSNGAVIDLTKGTATTTNVSGSSKVSSQELKAYTTSNGGKVFQVGSDYYAVNGTQLTKFTGDVASLTQYAAGMADNFSAGNTNKVVTTAFVGTQKTTYGESVSSQANAGTVQIGSTDPKLAQDKGISFNLGAPGAITETAQSVSTGIIGTNEDKSNKYGTEVSKTVTADGKTTTEKTTITAGGITTTGTIDAKDYLINGVSIVDNIKTSVDGAVAGATEEIDKKVAQVDEKIVEVDKRLTEFNTTASNLNSRVDQLNGRIDDVEETAYRGIAIALAAQQAIPNIGAGQTAVFGGVGHYEGESAGALGVATVFADGRTSVSGALGVAGGGEVGGRVGVAYVFGGK